MIKTKSVISDPIDLVNNGTRVLITHSGYIADIRKSPSKRMNTIQKENNQHRTAIYLKNTNLHLKKYGLKENGKNTTKTLENRYQKMLMLRGCNILDDNNSCYRKNEVEKEESTKESRPNYLQIYMVSSAK